MMMSRLNAIIEKIREEKRARKAFLPIMGAKRAGIYKFRRGANGRRGLFTYHHRKYLDKNNHHYYYYFKKDLFNLWGRSALMIKYGAPAAVPSFLQGGDSALFHAMKMKSYCEREDHYIRIREDSSTTSEDDHHDSWYGVAAERFAVVIAELKKLEKK